MTIVYILIGLALLAAVSFLLLKKKPEELPPAEEKALPPRAEPSKAPASAKVTRRETPAAKAEERPPPAPPPKAEERPPPAPPPKAKVEEGAIEVAAPPPEAPKPAKKKPQDIAGLRKGLTQTRSGFVARLAALFTGKKEIDPNLLSELEEVMLTSDVGVKTTQAILNRIRDGMKKEELKDASAVWAAVRAEAARILSVGDGTGLRDAGKPTVVLMVGVNGVGKTTTIGKLATKAKAEGKTVLLAAGDTFRAAAVQQLEVWASRTASQIVKGKEGADPGAVAYEATSKAKESNVDLLFVDTAGRLQTKVPLMDEIKKIRKTIAKALDGAPHETLLVLDATTGQNALTQAAMFKEAVDITGIVLTKLDGTAKGGIVLAICDELKVPVRYVGLGERAEDLREFDPDAFVEALFGEAEGEARAA
jgi:fused signal recognition particle receptor